MHTFLRFVSFKNSFMVATHRTRLWRHLHTCVSLYFALVPSPSISRLRPVSTLIAPSSALIACAPLTTPLPFRPHHPLQCLHAKFLSYIFIHLYIYRNLSELFIGIEVYNPHDRKHTILGFLELNSNCGGLNKSGPHRLVDLSA